MGGAFLREKRAVLQTDGWAVFVPLGKVLQNGPCEWSLKNTFQ